MVLAQLPCYVSFSDFLQFLNANEVCFAKSNAGKTHACILIHFIANPRMLLVPFRLKSSHKCLIAEFSSGCGGGGGWNSFLHSYWAQKPFQTVLVELAFPKLSKKTGAELISNSIVGRNLHGDSTFCFVSKFGPLYHWT